MKVNYKIMLGVLLLFFSSYVVIDYIDRGRSYAKRILQMYYINVEGEWHVQQSRPKAYSKIELERLKAEALQQESSTSSYALSEYYLGLMEPGTALMWFRLAELQGSKKAVIKVNFIAMVLTKKTNRKVFNKFLYSNQ